MAQPAITEEVLYLDGLVERLRYNPLPRPSEARTIEINLGTGPELKRKIRSRLRKSRPFGSKRSPDLSPVFTKWYHLTAMLYLAYLL
jgi:hypothetical protein